MNALQAYRVKNSWASVSGDPKDSGRGSPPVDWSDLPDYQDVQQSVSKGWSDLRQAVVNVAPAAPSFATSTSRKVSPQSQEVDEAPAVKQVDNGGSAASLWGRVMDLASEQWELKVTQRDEIDDLAKNAEGDTHLIAVMKEYHISRAKTSDDLPAWLFPPTHRAGFKAWEDDFDNVPRRRTSMSSSQRPPPSSDRSATLRDVFDAPLPTQQSFPRPGKSRKGSQDSGYESSSSFSNTSMANPPSRATARLQSLKRERTTRTASKRDEEQESASLIPKEASRPPVPQVRRGLPSRNNLKG